MFELHLHYMKRSTASLFGLLLYLMVQAVTAMPVQWRMDCLTSGRMALSWGSSRSCGPQETTDEGTTIDVQCCVYSYVLVSHDAEVKGEAAVVSAPVEALPEPVAALVGSLDTFARVALCDHPPPDTGVALVRLRSLRL